MTTSFTSYTPLETLLLFQSLLSYGVEPSVFSRVSDLLKKNPHIRDAKDYDSARLTPDALRELYERYLRLLKKEEAKSELNNTNGAAEKEAQNGGSSSASRKRKAPSPSLPTVQEAEQHAHLIPALVTKLYARYREQVTEEIRAEERKYDRLKREVQEIERGEWDERIRPQEHTNGTATSRDAQASPTVPSRDGLASAGPTVAPDARAPGASPTLGNAASKSPGVRYAQAKIDAVINHDTKPSPKARPTPLERPLQPSPAPQGYAHTQQSPLHHRTPSQLSPRLPPPQPSNAGYRLTSPALHASPYSQSHPPHGPGQSPPPSQTGRPLSSPVVLPPPPGMPFPVPPVHSPLPGGSPPFRGPPSGPPPPHSPGSSHQYGPASQPNGPPFPPGPPPPHLQQPGSYYPPFPSHGAYHPPQPPPPPPPPVFRPPHQGGYMLPPFQVTPQDPTRVHQQQQRAQQQAAAAASNRTPAATTQPRTSASGVSRPPPPLYSQPTEPVPQPVQRPRPSAAVKKLRPTPLPIRRRPSARTLWIGTVPPDQYKKEPPPSPSISPVDDVFPPLPPPEAPPATKLQPKGRRKANAAETPRIEQAETQETPPIRTTRGQSKRTGGGSAASSAVTRRTRSQSIASHVEDVSADAGSANSRRVKPEPSTPANILEDDASTAADATPSTTTTTAPATRRTRRGTLQTQPPRPSKRKRSTLEPEPSPDRDAKPTPSAEPEPSTPHPEQLDQQPNTVLASRNFSRMSVPIMNDILSHRHASLFSNPVKEKNAEGYKDLIKRPQDLKSIRAAIAAGNRAVNALTSASAGASGARDSPAGAASPGGVGTTVMLERTEELVPPKGIVSSAQLERELMRMFANAVMFNPGEEGVVRDAREMFESVQGAVSNWRSAERRTEDKEEDDAGTGEGEGGGSGRRGRK